VAIAPPSASIPPTSTSGNEDGEVEEVEEDDEGEELKEAEEDTSLLSPQRPPPPPPYPSFSATAAKGQGLTLVHYSVDVSASCGIRPVVCRVSVTKTAQVELRSVREEAPSTCPLFGVM